MINRKHSPIIPKSKASEKCTLFYAMYCVWEFLYSQLVFFHNCRKRWLKKLCTVKKWYQEFIFSGNINKFSIGNNGSRLNTWSVLLMFCNLFFVDNTKNACIIHTTKSDVQLHHTQITSSGIFTNIHVLFLVVSNIKFRSPVCFIYATLHSLKGMDFFLFHRALWHSEESRLLIFPTIADGFRKCTK